jgi:hypothetical protein
MTDLPKNQAAKSRRWRSFNSISYQILKGSSVKALFLFQYQGFKNIYVKKLA